MLRPVDSTISPIQAKIIVKTNDWRRTATTQISLSTTLFLFLLPFLFFLYKHVTKEITRMCAIDGLKSCLFPDASNTTFLIISTIFLYLSASPSSVYSILFKSLSLPLNIPICIFSPVRSFRANPVCFFPIYSIICFTYKANRDMI